MATDAPDLSEFVKLSHPRRKQCPIGEAIHLTAEEDEQLDAACAADKRIITSQAIVKWLEARGVTISPQFVGAHRRKQCSCYGTD